MPASFHEGSGIAPPCRHSGEDRNRLAHNRPEHMPSYLGRPAWHVKWWFAVEDKPVKTESRPIPAFEGMTSKEGDASVIPRRVGNRSPMPSFRRRQESPRAQSSRTHAVIPAKAGIAPEMRLGSAEQTGGNRLKSDSCLRRNDEQRMGCHRHSTKGRESLPHAVIPAKTGIASRTIVPNTCRHSCEGRNRT